MHRRHMLKAIAGCALPALARAQQWPSRPITWIYPYAPGGGADPLARSLAAIVGPRLGQHIIVENKTGASGMIGATAVAHAPADGQTFLFCVAGEVVINQWLFHHMSYDPEKDLTAVCRLTTLPFVLVSSKKSNITTVPQLLAAAKANPGKLTFGSPGKGTLQHIAYELLQRSAGIKLTHVPYRGIAAVTSDLLAGHIDLAFVGLSTALPHVRGGRLNGLGLSTQAPVPGVSELAPLAALDTFKGFDVTQWFGMMAPTGTPQPIIDRMADELGDVIKLPQVTGELKAQGLTPAFLAPAQFASFIASEREKYGRVIKDANITIG